MAQEIQFQSSLPQLVQLLAGNSTSSKSGTSGNTGTSGTSSSTSGTDSSGKTVTVANANTDPLMAAFEQAMGNSAFSTPQMQQLIASIFQEGAQQVPALTQQYANATGSRVSGNSGLQLALGDLNRQLSTTAAKALIENQVANTQIASQAAGNIANVTRGTTVDNAQQQQVAQQGTQQQQQTNQSTTKQAQTSGVNQNQSLLLAALGFGLNQADKRGLLNGIKLGGTNNAAATAPTAFSDPSFNFQLAPTTDYANIDTGQLGAASGDPYGSGIYTADAPAAFSSFSDSAPLTFDAATGNPISDLVAGSNFDFSSIVGDSAPGFTYENSGVDFSGYQDWNLSDWDATGIDWSGFSFDDASGLLGSGISDVFDYSGESWFANGGSVNPQMRKISQSRPTRSVQMLRPAGRYASGGQVRNVPNMGAPISRTPLVPSINYAPPAATPVNNQAPQLLNPTLPARIINPGQRGQLQVDSTTPNMGTGSSGITADMVRSYLTAKANTEAEAQRELLQSQSGQGAAVDVPSVVGTVSQNEAAVNGMGIAIASAITGVPAAVLGLIGNMIGINNTSMNPMSQLISAITGNLAADPNAAPPANISNQEAQDNNEAVNNAVATDNPADAAIAAAVDSAIGSGGISVGDDGGLSSGDPGADAAANAGGIGDGVGTGGDASPSSSADGGIGSADGSAYQDGGLVRGPRGVSNPQGVADSVPVPSKAPGGKDIRYSEGEFVIPVDVINLTGIEPWQQLINSFHIPAISNHSSAITNNTVIPVNMLMKAGQHRSAARR